MSAISVNTLLLSCAIALGALAVSPPSAAQGGSRDQILAIEQEYSRHHGGARISDDQLEYYLDRRNSGWTMDRIRQDIAGYDRQGPGEGWRAEQGWSPTAVVCSSIDNRYRECTVPFRGRAVLNQQISQSACIEGQSWGQKQGLVWVSRGCRARFTMVADGRAGMPGNGPSVVCRSREGERVVCNTGMNGRVQLISRFRNSGPCVEGRTWGQRRNHVWVSDNCRARFAAVYPDRAARGDWMRDDRSDWMRGDRGRMGDGSDYSVVCTSNGSPQHCNWDTRYGTPRLVQRTSQADCVQGRSWGYTERGGLWVSEGCHARFAVR